jgi:2-polyprenyl-3-methyl-5-hydroxy-6-metoxy-1,4-benzoquinol methylase
MKRKYNKNKNNSGFISASPLPSENELQKFYADSYYQLSISATYQESYSDLEINYKNLKCDALLHAIKSHNCIKNNLFLDIGSGEGFLLNSAFDKGYDVTGIDFSSYGIEKFFPKLLKRHISGDLFKSIDNLINKGLKYDVCTATNLLEHVIDPVLLLKLLKKLINKNGLIAITVPNDFSQIQQLALKNKMIDDEFWFIPPQHLHYFNTDNLEEFIIKNGFKIVDAFSGFPIDLFLLHSKSNYIKNKKNGHEANMVRMMHDLMIVDKYGIEKYLNYYRAMFNIGIGRDITIIIQQK